MRQSWSDDRLDDLNLKVDRLSERVDRLWERVDRLSERVDRRFDAVDRRFERVEDEFVAVRREMKEGFEGLHKTIIQVFGGLAFILISGLLGIIATQL